MPRAATHAAISGSTFSTSPKPARGSSTTDRAALEHLATDRSQTLIVFTPAWEPPLLELRDFLAELRQRIGPAASIVVAPVPDGPRAVTEVERATWQRAIAQLADPKVYLETGAA